MSEYRLLDVNLRLFDGEGGAAAQSGGTQAGSADAGQGETGGTQQTVVYGKQTSNPAAAGQEQQKQTTPEEMEKAYRKLVDGDYKDQYAKDVDQIIRRRLKASRDQAEAMQARIDSYQPLLDQLSQRYGVTDGDVSKLVAALEGDTAYMERAAEDAGMSVEQFRQFQQLKATNDRLLRQEEARRGKEMAQRQYNKWIEETEQAKQTYPGLDLRAEVQNPQFLSMLRSGVPVQVAYEAIHHSDLVQAAMSTSAQNTEKKVADSIRAKGARPKENGTASQSGFVVRDDVSKLSSRDVKEIIRRVNAGEKISFG